jgi:radical SAM superfamily enzyme YgiQ (UPF0313 family)
MKVLLVATNQADRYMDGMAVRPLPVGLAYVAAHISTTRHELRVLDLMFAEHAVAETLAAVKGFGPEVVGLSIRNLDNQSYLNPVWYLPSIRMLIAQLRSASAAHIVCGGPGFSVLPGACFDYLGPDFGLAGDAAESFARLVDCLDAGDSPRELPGIVYREQGRTIVRESQFTTHFETLPRLDLLDLRRYDKAGFGIGVITKLAPYYYATAENRDVAWRIRPIEEILGELRWLQKDFGLRKIFFIDSGFNVPWHAAKAFCQALLQSELRFRWNSFLRIGACDAELIGLMRRSGCSLALINSGLETAATGDAWAEVAAQVEHLTALCKQNGLPFALSASFGTPGETRSTVEQKLALLRQTDPPYATLRVATRVLPYTPLATTALAEGLINSPSDLISPTFYLAPGVRDWLIEVLRAAAATHPRWHLM